MVVTAHYIDAEFKIKKKIIWFKELEYPHSGHAIDKELLRCLTDQEIREKIFTLTLDNACNNATACELLVIDCVDTVFWKRARKITNDQELGKQSKCVGRGIEKVIVAHGSELGRQATLASYL